MKLKGLYIFLYLLSAVNCDFLKPAKKKQVNLTQCELCRLLVKSFRNGIERTSRGNFAGGDTAWEEEKLGTYYRSEVRLVEIQETLCLDVQEGRSQCHTLAENTENHVELWWFKRQDEEPDLEIYLCIKIMKLRAKLCIAAIWGVAGALAAPIVVVQRVEFVEEFRGGRCTTKPFCTIVGMSPRQMGLYRLVLFLIQYVTPLCVISYVYARMALRLWGSRAPGNAQGSRDAALMRNKKRVIKMLVIVVAMFAFCWLPLQTYNVLQNVLPSINEYRYINIIWFCCDWLAMSNSCCNPFIYGIYNEKFKREFRQRCPFGARASSPSPITESVELDKTSLRSYDWRRGCSTRATHHHHQTATAAGHVNGTPHAASRRSAASAGGAGGAAPCGPPASAPAASAPAVVAAPGVYVFPGARVRRSELHSSLEELCL